MRSCASSAAAATPRRAPTREAASTARRIMGLLALKRLMSLQHDRDREQRRQQLRAPMNKRQGSAYQPDEDGDSQTGKRIRSSVPELPEDILCHIHSLMSLCDAAHAACLYRTFLHSWRCRPNLNLKKDTLCSKAHTHKADFSDTIDSIMRNHSGIGVKILNLELFGITYHNLNSWLQVAVTPGIEELTVAISTFKNKYNFPCSLLSNGVGKSIPFLDLSFCEFHPTAELGPSLTSLNLFSVHITGNELRVPFFQLSWFRAVGPH